MHLTDVGRLRRIRSRQLGSIAAVLIVASTARADTLIASLTDDALVISKVAGDQVTNVYKENVPTTDTYAYAFAGTSLWVLRYNNASRAVTVGKVDDGKAAQKSITSADFKLAEDPGFPSFLAEPTIMSTKSGEVWLERCADMKTSKYITCARQVYLRIDDGSMTVAAKAPTDIVSKPVAPKSIAKAPKGYTIKLASQKVNGKKYNGIECKGPVGKLVWPTDADPPHADYTPSAVKTAWVSASPAIAHVSLRIQAPFERFDDDLYIVECRAYGETLRPLPGGGWLLGTNVVKADGSLIGEIPGMLASVAISP
jgi:hypothetical protein